MDPIKKFTYLTTVKQILRGFRHFNKDRSGSIKLYSLVFSLQPLVLLTVGCWTILKGYSFFSGSVPRMSKLLYLGKAGTPLAETKNICISDSAELSLKDCPLTTIATIARWAASMKFSLTCISRSFTLFTASRIKNPPACVTPTSIYPMKSSGFTCLICLLLCYFQIW